MFADRSWLHRGLHSKLHSGLHSRRVIESAKHEIYGLATGTLPTDRMRFREKVCLYPDKHKLHEKISSSEKLESLGRSPAKHVSTALQTSLRTGTLCGVREAQGSLSENREMFVNSEQIPATFCTVRYSRKNVKD